MDIELINGVFFYPIDGIITTGGSVLHAIKGMDNNLPEFGECYFSTAESRKPKAWKKHSEMICNLFVPAGSVQFVFFDDREDSIDNGRVVEFVVSKKNYGRLVIHPGIWFSFSGLSDGESLVLNVSNILHDPAESTRLEPGAATIPYHWKFD